MTRPRLLLASTLLVVPLLASCSGGGSGSQDADPASSSPVATPTGSPFSVEIEGPDVAAPGDVVTATLTNTGRLPDAYQLQPDPQGAATFAAGDVTLSPGESTEVQLQVLQVPVIVLVQSISGGSGSPQASLSIGAQPPQQ